MRLETERLVIRSFELADLPAYAAIVADERVTRYLGDGRPYSYEAAEAYVLDCIRLESEVGMSRYAVELSDVLIGFCGFKPHGNRIDFGWRYAHRYWGQGYATEAALAVLKYGNEELGLSGIVAGSYEANAASIGVIEKLGFRFFERTETDRGAVVWYEQQEARPTTRPDLSGAS